MQTVVVPSLVPAGNGDPTQRVCVFGPQFCNNRHVQLVSRVDKNTHLLYFCQTSHMLKYDNRGTNTAYRY